MNLKPIRPALTAGGVTTLMSSCLQCKGGVRSDTGYADLDGAPFKAYYCAGCAPRLLQAAHAKAFAEQNGGPK